MQFTTTETVSISVAALAFLGSITSAFYTYSNRNRELDIKLVELGIGILRADPKDTGLTAARGWAVQVIEENSRVRFSDDDRATLLHKPLLFSPTDRAIMEMMSAIQSSLQAAASTADSAKNTNEEMTKMMMMMMLRQNQTKDKPEPSTSSSPEK